MKKHISIITLFCTITSLGLFAFCGFYCAKAGSNIFNKTSEVIIVRDGEKETVTMKSDFEGDAKDFAMVIPVPTVIKKEQVKVVSSNLFKYLDDYSAPRLAEYYDPSPCFDRRIMYNKSVSRSNSMPSAVQESLNFKEEKVKVLEEYTVGEYDIKILSSEESSALSEYLDRNGYKIPKNAQDVIEPYIKSKMNFFVVKVNITEKAKLGSNELRPIQMTFNTPKFILPIRLGMANSTGYQDMIVYAFAKEGRIETTNYRTTKIPSDINVPEFIKNDFTSYYKDLFNLFWKNNKDAVILEYAWDLDGNNYVKCDPCVSTPPSYENLAESGIDWLKNVYNGGGNYDGKAFMTRLHLRYNRENFPQDLHFQTTPNRENFQGRYVMNIAQKNFEGCDNQKLNSYIDKVISRRKKELYALKKNTDWDIKKYNYYLDEFIDKKSISQKEEEELNKWMGKKKKSPVKKTIKRIKK